MKEKTFLDIYMECVAGDVCGGSDAAVADNPGFSGDTYEPNNTIIPRILGGGRPITRFGHPLSEKKKKKRSKK